MTQGLSGDTVITRVIKLPEYQGQTFHLTGVEVLGYPLIRDIVITVELSKEVDKSPIELYPYDDNLNTDGIYRYNCKFPIIAPYIRYTVTTTGFDVRDVNLLGFFTETVV